MRKNALIWLGRLTGMMVGLLLAWLLLEIGMRVGFKALPPAIRGEIQHVRAYPWDADSRLVPVPPFYDDTTFQSRTPPGLKEFPIWANADGLFHVTTIPLWESHIGFRTEEPRWPVDIVAVGDSFTFCWVEFAECWVERLHQTQGWSVMNLGQYSTGSKAHLEILKGWGVPLAPQVVIWQWYGNDFNDDYGLSLWQGAAPVENDDPPRAEPPRDYGAFSQYSAVYTTLRYLIEESRDPRSQPGEVVTVHGQHMLVGNPYFLHAFNMERPSNQRGYDLTLAALEEAAQLISGDMQAAMVIVLIPTKEEVYAEYVVDSLGADYLDQLSAGREQMHTLCEEKGWHCIDPTERFQAEVREGRHIFYGTDLHINPHGNAVLAEIVSTYLIDHNILSPRP